MNVKKIYDDDFMKEVMPNKLVEKITAGDTIQIKSMTYKKPKTKEMIELEVNHLNHMILQGADKKSIEYQIEKIDNIRKQQPIIRIDKDSYIDYRTGEIKQFEHTDTRYDNQRGIRNTMAKLRDIINININSENIENVLFITCTYAENMTDLSRLYTDHKVFIKKARKQFGHFEYIMVKEPQQRGAWHIHTFWIFDKKTYIPNNQMEKVWGHGFVKVEKLDGVNNVGAYLTSYLTDIDISEVDNIQGQIVEKKSRDTQTTKKYVKNGRLSMYPNGMNIYHCSNGIIKEPQKETMTYKVAVESCNDLKRLYKSQVILQQDDFENIITNEYYNKQINKIKEEQK